MSRSYKKHPRVKDSANKFMKKYANKKVRRAKDIPSGKAYRKVFESWAISDWNWIWTKREAEKDWFSADEDSWIRKHFETLEEYLIYWEKCAKRK